MRARQAPTTNSNSEATAAIARAEELLGFNDSPNILDALRHNLESLSKAKKSRPSTQYAKQIEKLQDEIGAKIVGIAVASINVLN